MKRGVIVVLIVSILFLSIGFVSANIFSDIWNKITGKGITGNVVAGDWCGYSDVNRDGEVSLLDYNIVKARFGNSPCDNGNDYCDNADVTRDGQVGLSDYNVVKSNMGMAGCVGEHECNSNSDCGAINETVYCNAGSLCAQTMTPTCLSPAKMNSSCQNIQSTPQCSPCAYGCLNNACKAPEVVACNDTDGGLNYFLKGNLTNSVSLGTNFEDYCLQGYPDQLIERHCLGWDLNNFTVQYTCPNGCSDGACIEEQPVILTGCDIILDKVKTPQEFTDAYGNVYSTGWNNNYTWNFWTVNGQERQVTTYSAGWHSNQGNQWLQPYYSVHVFADGVKASEYLDQIMSWGNLCSSEELENTLGEKQVVYKCSYYDKNMDSNNNNNNLVTYWANENVLVEFRGYIGEQYSKESEILAVQNRLANFVRELQGNSYRESVQTYLPWNFEMLIRKDLSTCKSELKMTVNPQTNETCSSCWQCKIEPAICPPHGYQQKTCIDSCCNQPKKEESVYCSPGICAGCIIPRWIGSSDNICMPYGFRLGKESSDSDDERLNEGDFQEYSLDIVSANSAILTVYYGDKIYGNKMKNSSYELFLNQETYIQLPEWDSSISSVSIKVTNIVKAESADEKGYVDAVITATKTYNAYCDVDGSVKEQKKKQYDGSWESCQNNYECDSNLCSSGECVEVNDMINNVAGYKATGVKILCKFVDMFGVGDYDSCLVSYLGNDYLQNTAVEKVA